MPAAMSQVRSNRPRHLDRRVPTVLQQIAVGLAIRVDEVAAVHCSSELLALWLLVGTDERWLSY